MAKREKLRDKIFKKPTAADVSYDEVISWLRGRGALVDESNSGSRVLIEYNGKTHRLHRPHGKGDSSLPKYAVEYLREYLILVGM